MLIKPKSNENKILLVPESRPEMSGFQMNEYVCPRSKTWAHILSFWNKSRDLGCIDKRKWLLYFSNFYVLLYQLNIILYSFTLFSILISTQRYSIAASFIHHANFNIFTFIFLFIRIIAWVCIKIIYTKVVDNNFWCSKSWSSR